MYRRVRLYLELEGCVCQIAKSRVHARNESVSSHPFFFLLEMQLESKDDVACCGCYSGVVIDKENVNRP